ncbi:hypothetical protein [Nocardioides nanhaiensis]|uniref:Uncharacterized protein n=1 Tax=Nocardioides nanhaiensis TaxID=1476871 RepID=A0ABP8WMV3_9ACTN
MSTYDPYQPPEQPADGSRPDAEDPFDSRHRPELELDPPDPNDPQWRSTGSYRPTSGLYANAYSSHTSSGVRSGANVAMGAIGVLVVVVFAVVVGSMASQRDSPTGTYDDGFAQCAAEHDEDSSLFSDAEWCDLELNGGDGDGDLTDMGGISDEGGFDVEDYFPDDPYGP